MLEFLHDHRIVVTVAALSLLSLLLLSSTAQRPGRPDPLARVVLEVMRPLQAAVTAGIDVAGDGWTTYVGLVGVRRENERLARRVLELEQQLVRLNEVEQAEKRLAGLLGFRSSLDLPLLAALVVGRDPLPVFGTLTVNRGEADGIRRNMAVLSAQGVVGRTIDTSPNAARVLLITDHNSGVDAVVQRTRARGIVEGALDGRCVMKYLKREEDVEVGDAIVTSGLDGIFPKGVSIGTVTHVTRGTRGLLQVAEVQPSAPLDRVEEVVIVPAPATGKDKPS
ncbi:rod shape-determining protein MreC [Candidatus Binatia bacterium]|nr:rod shape-determining protein MreC [Candidatus Binatia bacterium]